MNKQEPSSLVSMIMQFLTAGDTLGEASRKARSETPDLTAISLAQALAVVVGTSASQVLETPGESQAGPLDQMIQLAGALQAAGYTLDEVAPAMVAPGVYPDLNAYQLGLVLLAPQVFPLTSQVEMRAALAAANFSSVIIDSEIVLLFPSSPVTTATVFSSSLDLNFSSDSVSAGEAVTFLDPLTSINIAMRNDGNGNWKATISCSYPNTTSYLNQAIGVGETYPIGVINGVSYSTSFSNEPGKRLFEAIRVTLLGH